MDGFVYGVQYLNLEIEVEVDVLVDERKFTASTTVDPRTAPCDETHRSK